MKKKKTSGPNQALLILLIVVIVGFGIFLLLNLSKKAKVTQEESNLRETLMSRGIHPDPVTILALGTNAQWEDRSIAYNLVKVYLTPDIADLGSSRNNTNLKDKSFLIAQVGVRDRRTSGQRNEIIASNYFRIRTGGLNSAPVVADYLYLSPQENGTVYVTFPVNKGVNKFSLLAGVLSKPRVIELDFQSKSVITLKGVFLTKQGFATEYKGE